MTNREVIQYNATIFRGEIKMSFWTQTNVTFVVGRHMTVTEIENFVGHIMSWDDLYYFKPEDRFYKERYKILPMGSEGSLDITVKKVSKYKTVFTVHGGLRDRYDTKDVEKWFSDLIEADKNGDDFHGHIILKAYGYTEEESFDGRKQLYYKHKFTTKEKINNFVWAIRRRLPWR